MRNPPLASALAAAARVIAAVLAGHTPEATLAALDPAVRPAARDLSFQTLRDHGRGDFFLARLLARPLVDRPTRALLLVALARLERRPEQVHTLVDQAVSATPARFKALINAVLRNFLRRREVLIAAADADAVAHWRHPAWWLERLQADFPAEWRAIAAGGNDHPPQCLRVNRRRIAGADFAGQLTAAGIAVRALDATALLVERPLPVERLPGFAEGLCSVQDWGAQQAAPLLAPRVGMRVLDACAAPGGKTAHLLELAEVELLALEQDARRARRIESNLARLGLSATVRVADAARSQSWWDGRPFERILADVPCSASGVARRHPDAKWLRRAADVAAFAQAQAAILEALWPTLAAGGRMLYCTCSLFAVENAGQVGAFEQRHPDARRVPIRNAPDLQLLPTPVHDGFYFALLEKAA